MSERLKQLSDAGVSIWLDDLSRDRLRSGNLQRMIEERHVVGVTTNPSIFAKALSQGDDYSAQLRELKAGGASLQEVVTTLTSDDVREACDLLAGTYRSSGGFDGRVSIEVDPRLAHETDTTVDQARQLHALVDRENLLVKIPATDAGLPAITQTIAAGISVNVTLIFSVERYTQVLEAWLAGLEQAHADGRDLTGVHSVASVFVSRTDTAVDTRLEEIGTEAASELRGQAAIAVARLCFEAYEQVMASERWKRLEAAGANPQRPLWASTSTKDPSYRDTMYVEQLVTRGTVNTMPEETLLAFADHGEVHGDTVRGTYDEARNTLDAVEAAGVNLVDVFRQLEAEGVQKFITPWEGLLETMKEQLAQA